MSHSLKLGVHGLPEASSSIVEEKNLGEHEAFVGDIFKGDAHTPKALHAVTLLDFPPTLRRFYWIFRSFLDTFGPHALVPLA